MRLLASFVALGAVALLGAGQAFAHEGDEHGSGFAGGAPGFGGHSGFVGGFGDSHFGGGLGSHSHFGGGFGHSHFGGFGHSHFGHSTPSRTFLHVPDYHRRPMMAPRPRSYHHSHGGLSIWLNF